MVLRTNKPNDELTKIHETILETSTKHLDKFVKSAETFTTKNEHKYISHITSITAAYILHLASIKAFGLADFNASNRWSNISRKQVTLNIKQRLLINTNDKTDEGKQLLAEAEKEYILNKQDVLTQNTN